MILNLAMPDIEIGRNKKGNYAILKITRSDPVVSEDEIIGLNDYKSIGKIHIPGSVYVHCGEIEKERLLEIFLERASTTTIKELLAQG